MATLKRQPHLVLLLTASSAVITTRHLMGLYLIGATLAGEEVGRFVVDGWAF
jgi:hypothetical protein